MAKMITGSLCLTDILEHAKAAHTAFKKAENGKLYMNVLIWENDEPDKFNNNFSVQLNPIKDAPDDQKKKYIGNLKHVAFNATNGLPTADATKLPDINDLPF